MGNMYFASVNQLSVCTASRRDDLHGLMYLLIYLLNNCSLPCIDSVFTDEVSNVTERLQIVLQGKKQFSLSQMCTGRAAALERLGREVDALEYTEAPNYDKLRKILTDLMNVSRPVPKVKK
jgi:hypothetical protein